MGKAADTKDGHGAYDPSYPKNDAEKGVAGPTPSPSYDYPGYSAAPTTNPSQAGWVAQPGQVNQQNPPPKDNTLKIVLIVLGVVCVVFCVLPIIGVGIWCCCVAAAVAGTKKDTE